MDGRMDGWMNGWMDVSRSGWMSRTWGKSTCCYVCMYVHRDIVCVVYELGYDD